MDEVAFLGPVAADHERSPMACGVGEGDDRPLAVSVLTQPIDVRWPDDRVGKTGARDVPLGEELVQP